MNENVLYYGDNLDILRQHVATESVDLVYLDPPFNSNRSYNVLFKTRSGDDSQAQVEAFKGGRQLNPGMVRDLVGTVEQQKADMGVFICLGEPTRGMVEVANGSGSYACPVDGRRFPKVQIVSIADLFAKMKPDMPTPFLPYVQARRLVDENAQRLF